MAICSKKDRLTPTPKRKPSSSKHRFAGAISLMFQKSGDHQLRLVVVLSTIISRVLYISGGCLGLLNHQLYVSFREST